MIGVAGDDGGAGFAAFEEVLAGGHGEAAEFAGGVAGEAVLGQYGADLGFKELSRVVRGGEGDRGRDGEWPFHMGTSYQRRAGVDWAVARPLTVGVERLDVARGHRADAAEGGEAVIAHLDGEGFRFLVGRFRVDEVFMTTSAAY